MPASVYEFMFLLDTAKVAGDVQAAAKQMHAVLEKHQAEILASRPWDERRLSYPIDGHKKGLYYLIYIKAESKALLPIEQDFKLNEMVIRSLVLKIDPKLVDTMLALARDEHALALHAVADEPGEGGEGEGEGDHPRRGPRRGHDGDKD